MDTLLRSTPIERQLFKHVDDLEHRGNSCVIFFRRRRKRGRYLVVMAIIISSLLLLALSSQAGVGGL